ncbi:MAG: hypothetical protein KBA11_05930 [Sedimentibacter sp.]|nr:hypothetical protein [Sedimentibacter sp.]
MMDERRRRRASNVGVIISGPQWVNSTKTRDTFSIYSETKEDLVVGDTSISWSVQLIDSYFENGSNANLIVRLYESSDGTNWTLVGSRSTSVITGSQKSAYTNFSSGSVQEGLFYKLDYELNCLPIWIASEKDIDLTINGENRPALNYGATGLNVSVNEITNNNLTPGEDLMIYGVLKANNVEISNVGVNGFNGDVFQFNLNVPGGIKYNTKYRMRYTEQMD